MLAFSNDYYGLIFRATQSVELFCAYEELKRQLLEDKEFMQQLKVGMNMEGESEKEQEEVKNDGMDMDEEMMMAGLSMFENDF